MVLIVDALLTSTEAYSTASAVYAKMTYAGPDSTFLAVDTPLAHSGSLWIAFRLLRMLCVKEHSRGL